MERLRAERSKAATSHALSTLWGIGGWVAYVTDAALLVLIAAAFTERSQAPGTGFSVTPWIALYAFEALALTALLAWLRVLKVTVHWVAPILFVVLIAFFVLFSPAAR